MAKKIGNTLFFIAVFALTVWAVLYGADLKMLMQYLSSVRFVYILPSVLFVLGFILSESLIFFYLFRALGLPARLSRCCLYSFIGFFYCCITPSASGGQPMQLIYMRKDRLPVGPATVVLAIVTIVYKLVLVLLGVAVMAIRPPAVMQYLQPIEIIVYIGLVLNVAFIALLLLLVFNPTAVRTVANWIFNLIHSIRPFRNLEARKRWLEELIGQYQGAADFYRSHKGIMVNVLLITFVQRFLLFAVTWMVYLSFGLSGHSMPLLATLQGMISVAVDMLPLPGGMGVSEALFLQVFEPIFGAELALPGMILSRGISFYSQLLISAVMTVVAVFLYKRKKAGS